MQQVQQIMRAIYIIDLVNCYRKLVFDRDRMYSYVRPAIAIQLGLLSLSIPIVS